MPLLDYQIRLPDGRLLGYRQLGDLLGETVLYFHGWPGSRVEAGPLDPVAAELGIRMVAVDRPGYGLSTLERRRRIRDWPADIAVLLDRLELERCRVVAVSGGAPYALSCAALLPDRIRSVALLCPVAPVQSGLWERMNPANLWMKRSARLAPVSTTLLFRPLLAWFRRKPVRLVEALASSGLARPDREILARAWVRELLGSSFGEALAQGGAGVIVDGLALVRPWELDLAAIRAPVRLFHGDSDRCVPSEMGRWLSDRLPGCRMEIYPDEGHFSLLLNRYGEISRALFGGVDAAGPPPAGLSSGDRKRDAGRV